MPGGLSLSAKYQHVYLSKWNTSDNRRTDFGTSDAFCAPSDFEQCQCELPLRVSWKCAEQWTPHLACKASQIKVQTCVYKVHAGLKLFFPPHHTPAYNRRTRLSTTSSYSTMSERHATTKKSRHTAEENHRHTASKKSRHTASKGSKHRHTTPKKSRRTAPNVPPRQASLPDSTQTVAQENVAQGNAAQVEIWNESDQFKTEQDFMPPTQDFWLDTILNFKWVDNARVGWLPGMEITHTRPGVDPYWPSRQEFEECAAPHRELWRAKRRGVGRMDSTSNSYSGMDPTAPIPFADHDGGRTVQDHPAYKPVWIEPRGCGSSSNWPATSVGENDLYYATPRC
ncbi:hypothetical protein B0H21DRAFT_175432 [Amylocystis lapponica]|nr:hypothetical protein B0H21DRAFT_175432 [Amylocystis lapponica]